MDGPFNGAFTGEFKRVWNGGTLPRDVSRPLNEDPALAPSHAIAQLLHVRCGRLGVRGAAAFPNLEPNLLRKGIDYGWYPVRFHFV